MTSIPRRAFVRQGAFALVAMGLPPGFLTRTFLAREAPGDRGRTLVCIFLRGAVDGLSMVIPFNEQAYHAERRLIAVPVPGRTGIDPSLDLDGFFAFHPEMRPLLELYRAGELAAIHAVGSPDPTRSHFDAQDFMESGTPGVKSTRGGWMNRLLESNEHLGCAECAAAAERPVEGHDPATGRTLDDPQAHAADHAAGQDLLESLSPFRGVAFTPELPRILRGSYGALNIPDLERFGVTGGRQGGLEGAFSRLYRMESGDEVSAAADESFEAVRILKAADPAQYVPREGVRYPGGNYGRSLRQIAQLIKSDIGLEIAFTDIGGWDTHLAQGGARGQLANRLRELSQGLRAFHDDLGDRMEDVVVLTFSEFGRTVAENGSGGTDHGHANCMLAMGGSVKGGRVLGRWPGLAREQRFEGRDLAVTTDFRDVLGEVLDLHMGTSEMGPVFPGYPPDRERYVGLL